MLTDAEWERLLTLEREPTPVGVERFLGGPAARSFSRPYFYLGGDKREYVVKLPRNNDAELRALASDQVIGRAGMIIGAAVAETATMVVEPPFLPPREEETSRGVAHATVRIPGLSDKAGIDHVPANRDRLGGLAVLYTWTGADDHQLAYDASFSVFSVDHGHFLPPPTVWTKQSLDLEPDPDCVDPWFDGAGLDAEHCRPARERLAAVTPSDVARLAKSGRPEWGVTAAERVALSRFLWRRRAATLKIFR